MKKNVLVVFGSMSSEHEVSCISASNVLENMDKNKYEVSKIGIDKQGSWYLYNGSIQNIKENSWMEDNDNKVLVTDIIAQLKKYDVVFPVLHGKYGEDGTIQGLFELAQVRYVGCSVLGSAIAMDKILSKEIVKVKNIPIVEYISLDKKEYKNLDISYFKKHVSEKILFPLIVKPNKEGSSYGVSKVDSVDNLTDAIEFAFKYDDKILIEKYIDNRQEIECAVIENGDEIYASTPGEIVSANEFYDYDAKYINAKSSTNIPANISEAIKEDIVKYAKEIFRSLSLSGLSRVDFFVSNNNIYFNEVNTLPGFTNISMYPKMLIHDGISYAKIIDILIENCLV